MGKMEAVRTGLGLVIALIGMMAADNDRLWIPAITIAIGLYLLKGVME